jgi:hypothetical protein
MSGFYQHCEFVDILMVGKAFPIRPNSANLAPDLLSAALNNHGERRCARVPHVVIRSGISGRVGDAMCLLQIPAQNQK